MHTFGNGQLGEKIPNIFCITNMNTRRKNVKIEDECA